MIALKRLYVECPNCKLVFPSGFQAESATQLLGFSYLCPKCRRICSCLSSEYLEKIGENFQKAIREEEVFLLPYGKRIAMEGPDIYELNREVVANFGNFLFSNKAIISFKQKDTNPV